MDPRSRPLLVVAIAAVAIGSVVGPAVLADLDGYEITVEGSVDVPDRTIDPDDVAGEYTISEIAFVDPGEEIRVTVDGPAGDTYDIQLRNPDREVELAKFVRSGRTETSFDTDGLSPGTYLVVVDPESSDEWAGVVPVIIEGYDVNTAWGAVPDSAEAGSEITIAASMSQRNDSDQLLAEDTPADVVIKEVDGDEFHRFPINQSDGDYTSTTFSFTETVPLDVPPGEYSVYVAARGTETIEGGNVPVGVSISPETIRVTEPPTPTPEPTPAPTPTPTPTDTPTPPPTEPPTTTTPPPTEPPTTTTSPPTEPPTTTTPPPTEPPTTTTPPPTEPPTTTTPSPADPSTTTPPEPGTATDTDPIVTPPPIETGTETATLARPSTETPTSDVVITPGGPATGNGTDDETVTPGQPGFTAVGVIAVLLILVGARLRRS